MLNLTDGEANDGDPVAAHTILLELRTEDGATLLFNLHISDEGGAPIPFPAQIVDPARCLLTQPV